MDSEYADLDALMFERHLPSPVASFAATFYFGAGRPREAKDPSYDGSSGQLP